MFRFLFESIWLYLFIPLIIYLLYVQKSKKKYKLPPGPKGWPFIGTIPDCMSVPILFKRLINEWKDKYGYVILFKTFGRSMVYVSDYKLAFEAFSLTFANELAGRPKRAIDILNLGNQEVLSVGSFGPTWINIRKDVMTIFRKVAEPQKMADILNRAYELFTAEIREQKELLETEEYFVKDLSHWLSHNIICMALYQDAVKYNDADYQAMMVSLENLETSYDSILFLEGTYLSLLPHPTKKLLLKYNKELTDILKIQMDIRRENGEYKSDPKFYIDYLMQIQDTTKEDSEKLANKSSYLKSDEYLANAAFDIYFGAMITFGPTFVWTIGLLATHPHVQEKIRKELRDMAATTGQSLNTKTLDELHYLKAAINEVMRVSSFIPYTLLHRAMSDVKIGEYDIPKDTTVSVNIYGIHHDPRYWKDPYEFIPERFLNDEGKFQLPKEGFMPFGIGKRICVAERYTVKETQFIFTGRLCEEFQIAWSSKNKGDKLKEDMTSQYVIFPEPFYVEFIPLS